jgi:hypothetical protein
MILSAAKVESNRLTVALEATASNSRHAARLPPPTGKDALFYATIDGVGGYMRLASLERAAEVLGLS